MKLMIILNFVVFSKTYCSNIIRGTQSPPFLFTDRLNPLSEPNCSLVSKDLKIQNINIVICYDADCTIHSRNEIHMLMSSEEEQLECMINLRLYATFNKEIIYTHRKPTTGNPISIPCP